MENQYELTFEETLASISIIHNTTPQLSTTETPSALLFGLDIMTPDAGMWSYVSERYNEDTHWRLVQQIRDDAVERLIAKYQDVFLREPKKTTINVGDLVFKKLTTRESERRRKLIGSAY